MGKTTTKSTKMTTTQINKNVHFTKKLCGRFLKKEGREAYEQIVLGLHGFNGQKGVHRATNKLLRWRLQRTAGVTGKTTKPPPEWYGGHRRRYGHEYSAAQFRRSG